MLWSGTCDWPADATARAFRPPLLPEACTSPISVLEVAMDTSEWGEAFWTEIDAIQIEGHALPSARGAASGGGAAASAPVDTWLDRMPWEIDAHFYARARFEKAQCGATPPATDEEAMRRARPPAHIHIRHTLHAGTCTSIHPPTRAHAHR